MRAAAAEYVRAPRVIACWAMGITQHEHGVANVQEIVNLLLLRGNIGVPGAGPCPVRGHSNVQGDRTVGITEKPSAAFLDALAREFDFAPPRAPGIDVVAAIRAMRDGRARAFVGMGGNFAVASPDSALTAAALERCDLTVQVSTTLNRTHLHCGREAYVLPCLGRTERDVQHAGAQFVTVEDSMSVVHRSEGRLRARVAAAAQRGRDRGRPRARGARRRARRCRGSCSRRTTTGSATRSSASCRASTTTTAACASRAASCCRAARGSGASPRATAAPHFTVHALPDDAIAAGRFRLTTLRSHDQFNTTIYGHDDRYRGITGDRRVVLAAPRRPRRARGSREGQRVDLTSHFRGETRCVRGFRIVAYDVPRGCAAAYFPEANPLVALDSVADGQPHADLQVDRGLARRRVLVGRVKPAISAQLATRIARDTRKADCTRPDSGTPRSSRAPRSARRSPR